MILSDRHYLVLSNSSSRCVGLCLSVLPEFFEQAYEMGNVTPVFRQEKPKPRQANVIWQKVLHLEMPVQC